MHGLNDAGVLQSIQTLSCMFWNLLLEKQGIKVQIAVDLYAHNMCWNKVSQIRNKHDCVNCCMRRESSNRHGFLKHFGLKNGEIADQKSSNLLQATVLVVRPSPFSVSTPFAHSNLISFQHISAIGSDRWPRDPKGFTFHVEPMDGGVSWHQWHS